MRDEEFFAAVLDDSPDDQAARWLLAEWLAERGDDRAEGLRWMVAHGKYPALDTLISPASQTWDWWSMLPGHEPYARALELAGVSSSGMRPATLHASATEYAWLALLPCVAIFLAVQALDRAQIRRLVAIFIAVAVCEALLGIVQAGAKTESIVHLGNPYAGGAATGTYINKIIQIQDSKAEMDDFVIYKHMWYMGGTQLGPLGRYQLDLIAKRLPTVPFPVVVATSKNDGLDEAHACQRQALVCTNA